jgi:peroxiredoxin
MRRIILTALLAAAVAGCPKKSEPPAPVPPPAAEVAPAPASAAAPTPAPAEAPDVTTPAPAPTEAADAAAPAPTPAPTEGADVAEDSSGDREVSPPPAGLELGVPTMKVGAPAPDFGLTDLDGKIHNLSSYKGKTVILEWFNPECPFVVKQHEEGPLKAMAADVTAKGDVVWLAINSGAAGKQGADAEKNRELAKTWGLGHPILLDPDGRVGLTYKARVTPQMVVIDPQGVVVYAGAIDNAPLGKVEDGATFTNHVAAALADLAAGRPVNTPETRAYGCSVKYADGVAKPE